MKIELREMDDLKNSGCVYAKRDRHLILALNENGIYNPTDKEFSAAVEYKFKKEKIEKAKEWIEKNMFYVKHYKDEMHSYKLKHIIEENTSQYLTNGEAIYLMRELGFACRFYLGPKGVSLNCAFNACFMPGVTRKYGRIGGPLFKMYRRVNKRLTENAAVLS